MILEYVTTFSPSRTWRGPLARRLWGRRIRRPGSFASIVPAMPTSCGWAPPGLRRATGCSSTRRCQSG